MTTEEWLIEQKVHATRALEAYQLLYNVYLSRSVTDLYTAHELVPITLTEQIEDLFRGE